MLITMKDLRKIIGDNLSELRKRRGLTQFELAEKFNYTDRAVSKWENGDTLPDVEVLYQLCEFYGVTIDYLTHEENSQFKKKDNPRLFLSSERLSPMIFLRSFIVISIALKQKYVHRKIYFSIFRRVPFSLYF